MKRPRLEANCKRATDGGEEGWGFRARRATSDNPRGDAQAADKRPEQPDELAQHGEVVSVWLRRNLSKLGADPGDVKLATRSRKGCWRMSSNSIVPAALTNAWLHAQGVPDLRAKWIALHDGHDGVAA